jgi:hypothetical protein
MEFKELIPERIKRGYCTAAIDNLTEILRDDPNNQKVLTLRDSAIKKYVQYSQKFVKRLLSQINHTFANNELSRSLVLIRQTNKITAYVKQLLKTLSKVQIQFITNSLSFIEKTNVGLSKIESEVLSLNKDLISDDKSLNESNRVILYLGGLGFFLNFLGWRFHSLIA